MCKPETGEIYALSRSQDGEGEKELCAVLQYNDRSLQVCLIWADGAISWHHLRWLAWQHPRALGVTSQPLLFPEFLERMAQGCRRAAERSAAAPEAPPGPPLRERPRERVITL